jgi:hypothetical protein
MPGGSVQASRVRWSVVLVAAVALAAVLVVAVGSSIVSRRRASPEAEPEVDRDPAAPSLAERRPPSGEAPPPDRVPRLTRREQGPGVVGWTSPGLCVDGALAATRFREKQALLRSFVATDLHDLHLIHDPRVPPGVLATFALAINRTRQYANHLLGWSPQSFPPAIHVYRTSEQLRAVACINASGIAYYDGSLHLTGDPSYTDATLRQEAVHEYVHHILVSMGVSRPAWLHEGLAMQIAEERWWQRPELGLPGWLRREHLPFDSLVDLFPHTSGDERLANAAYYQSYMMVAFLYQRRGRPVLRELLDDLAWRRVSPEEAFPRAAASASLEEEWGRFLAEPPPMHAAPPGKAP